MWSVLLHGFDPRRASVLYSLMCLFLIETLFSGKDLGHSCALAVESSSAAGKYGVASPESMVVGHSRATVVPVIGVAQGGARTVKSLNSLVDALGAPA
ncbi:hypothetical protein V6N12_067010 [Hibiscus sabdariffa]|uniref:Uncharacterized protein n=1 Tax=Hibiscus sabdariffa TaxID=183260 RepID=A0ABR2BKK3_9ROSI